MFCNWYCQKWNYTCDANILRQTGSCIFKIRRVMEVKESTYLQNRWCFVTDNAKSEYTLVMPTYYGKQGPAFSKYTEWWRSKNQCIYKIDDVLSLIMPKVKIHSWCQHTTANKVLHFQNTQSDGGRRIYIFTK